MRSNTGPRRSAAFGSTNRVAAKSVHWGFLLQSFLEQEVMDGDQSWSPEEGTPQGAVLSPLLSNIYLGPLAHQMAQKGFEMVRYADDCVVQCRSSQEADRASAKQEKPEEAQQPSLPLSPIQATPLRSRAPSFWPVRVDGRRG